MKLMTIAAAFAALVGLATPALAEDAKAATAESAHAPHAPAFTLKDLSGKEHSLEDFSGKTVVLEWINYGCPYVKKHYESKNMQKLQETYTGKDVVWLSIVSGKTAKGFSQADADAAGTKATAVLLDPTGETGKAYDAKTTPHMIVITGDGHIAYDGAIDSKASTDSADIPNSENYVIAALDSVLAGKEVATTKTKPYGCSVKY
ncbi:redoxin family protein [Roseibacillus persicicus]|uniref:Thioredoxin family protein n=1 Tax=Roseibacillus persicicus TaxID=454148 RepID=A0A918WJ44_9BACT|nr:redoxin family protein [Roseibacillus persicicus]MDQ8189782.1 redoxin domain-containing protein [Roseibacillus persicicus]GHC50542.1 thioredoxin family protein [Roseibacillus persicicus]